MRAVAVFVLLLVGAAMAGCAEKVPASKEEPLRHGSDRPIVVEPPPPRGMSQRWHFHDHWKGNPVLTLYEGEVELSLTLDDNGSPSLSNTTSLPRGVIVPPETGFLTINVSWDSEEPGPLNLSYRPADSSHFVPFGVLANGAPVHVWTSESMTDVPHRQESWWRFNFSAPLPDALDVGVAPFKFHVTIEATIGRPLFIDPPHLDWWSGGEVLRLVEEFEGKFSGVTTPHGGFSVLGEPAALSRDSLQSVVRVPVDAGRIVPEGAKSVVVLLNWSSPVPESALSVHWAEGNLVTSGRMDLVQDGRGSRVFVLEVEPAMTDTTYSNRTTWEFHVVPEGEDAAAFTGSFQISAWVTRHVAADALRAVLG